MYLRWNDAESCRDLVEALHNYAACLFMVRSWDWSALVLFRVCHEVQYFSQMTTDTKQQRVLMETYIDEVLTDNRQRLMAGKPPNCIREAKKLAVEVTNNTNGRGSELARKGDPYCSLREVKDREQTIMNLNSRVSSLHTEVTELRRLGDMNMSTGCRC